MEELTMFLSVYGWQLALIAAIGIVLLGAMKYANLFANIEKEKRKPIYFVISVGFSVVATIVYLLIIDNFSVDYVMTVSMAIYALNQTMYAVYETTRLRDLLTSVFTYLFNKYKPE